jgi:hypothetical protein
MMMRDINHLDISKSLYLNLNYGLRCIKTEIEICVSTLLALETGLLPFLMYIYSKSEVEKRYDHPC